MIQEIADPGPFDLRKGSKGVGVLFVHGFTASAAELRPMAQAVAESAGWRCSALLLPGHGTRIADMQGVNGSAWVAAVESAYQELSQECEKVLVVGLSLGAVLACHLAIRRQKDPKLRGLILLAPAFGVTGAREIGIRAGRLVRSLINKGTRASDYFLDHRLYSYLQIPLNRATEVLQLGRAAVENMSRLRDLPILMFVGDRESTVSLDKMLAVAQDHSWIRLVRLPRSRHILPVEPDKEILFEASLRFMEECVVGVSQ
jgi:carboxylesterase